MKISFLVLAASVLALTGCSHSPSTASAPASSGGAECGTLKTVPFGEFINNKRAGHMPFAVAVPERYELASIKGGAAMTAYWMPPETIAQTQETGNLPAQTGYMTVKPSANVAYDEKRNVFIGEEKIEAQFKAAGLIATPERYQSKGHSLLFIEAIENKSRKAFYSVHISANAGTIAFVITYRPPNDDKAIGDCVWGRLKQGLLAVDRKAMPGSGAQSASAEERLLREMTFSPALSARQYSPSYLEKIVRVIKSNILWGEKELPGARCDVEVDFDAGRIAARRVIRSEGRPDWCPTVLRALDRTERIPSDVDGRAPSRLVLEFRGKD
jgi:hypothetical protein